MNKVRRLVNGTTLLVLLGILLVIFTPQSNNSSAPTVRSVRSSGEIDLEPNTRQQSHAPAFVSEVVKPTLSIPARDLPSATKSDIHLDREINPRFGLEDGNSELRIPGGRDPLLDMQESVGRGSAVAFQTPIININGQGYTGVNPPDTVGDVGPNHYVQSLNGGGGALVQVYDKSGSPMGSAFAMEGLGSGQCASGLGDPIILYDRLADRWFFQEFSSSGNQLCIYISQTPDPLGSYYAYAFTGADGFPDYPKFGVWPDAYYGSSNDGGSPSQYAFDRATMLAGGAATYQSFATAIPPLSGFGFQNTQAADLDGPIAPPAGSPGIFMRHVDSEAHGNPGGPDTLEIWEYDVDFVTPANSSYSLAQTITISEFDSDLCGLTSFSCIDQPGGGANLDPLREVVMHRLQYRNDVGQETLVGTLTTDVSGSDQAGKRWFVLEKAGGLWSLADEGTYAPDGDSRWMGSISMDADGNIALAYNVSSNSTFPSLRYTGRLASDPAGTMPQGENVIINGSASNGNNRYGDYSSMNVDPADDCTFWFTSQYNVASTWNTRITTFRFDECDSTTPNPTPTPPIPTITPTPPAPGACTTYSSSDTPISLPNGISSISSDINIGGSGTIADVNVTVDNPHTWVGDLIFTVSHNGTSVVIIDQPGVPASSYGCEGDDILATLDDEATAPDRRASISVESVCASSVPTINGAFSPNNALSAFDGGSGNGTWTLTVQDTYTSADAGSLNSWSVEICTDGGTNPTATPPPPTATSPAPTPTND